MTANQSLDNVTKNVGQLEFDLERIFDAPRELVFKMFTEPEHLSQWWAPKPYTVPVCKIDLRPGGHWHYAMRSPQGEEHWVLSVYSEIIIPELVSYTAIFVDEEANPIVGGPPKQFGTVTFTEYEGKTRFNIRVQFATADDLEATMKMGMVEGLTMCFNNLDNYMEQL